MSMPHQAAIRAGITLVVSIAACTASADVSLNAMFGDHMVLQQGIRNRIWGRADAGEQVTVTLGGQSHTATAGPDGAWHVMLDPVTAYGGPHTLTVKGKNTLTFNDVLIGEVWICSGQSNMQWSVNQSNDADLEKAAASYPQIRFISVPQVGTQDPQWTFSGSWQACSPETVGEFSAVGFYFGRQLHQTLGVPVGLIDNAWGGSAAEAWVRRDRLAGHPTLRAIHERWEGMEAGYEAEKAAYDASVKKWEEAAAKAKADGTQPPARPNPGANPEGRMRGNARPGNIHSGVLTPSIGYGIRGVIWYQGESNASRAYQYRELFPLMIASWREEWNLADNRDFPFYWVQLADFKAVKPDPAESDWAELREAQTMTLDALPNTGEAVIIDLGEGKDIHPKNKRMSPSGSRAGRSPRPTAARAWPVGARAMRRWSGAEAASCCRSPTSSPRRPPGDRSTSPSLSASRSRGRIGRSCRRSQRSWTTVGSRSRVRPWRSPSPCGTRGPTTRFATCIPLPACRSPRFAPMTFRA